MQETLTKNLYGNENAYKVIASWINGGRLPHGILIEGESGSGKRTLARDIAAWAICENKNYCRTCCHCLKALRGIHPDIIVFAGEGKARSFHISAVREIIKEAYTSKNEANQKIFILENAHEMTTEAQNALLKLIEEPPANVIIIMTCVNKSFMLETVLSRLVSISTDLLDIDQCVLALEKLKPGLTRAEYEESALINCGNVGQALAKLSGDTNALQQEVMGFIMEVFCGSEIKALTIIGKYERKKSELKDFLQIFKGLVHSALFAKTTNSDLEKIKGKATRLQLACIIDITENVALDIDSNVNTVILCNLLCSKIKACLQGQEDLCLI